MFFFFRATTSTSSLGQRLTSMSLPSQQHHPLNPVGQCVRRESPFLRKAQWTDVRNLLQVETVKALFQVLVNFDINCSDVDKILINDGELRQKIQGVQNGEDYDLFLFENVMFVCKNGE
uniref:Uncharacterized protein n=1 Tax=Ditylenchus dipsaci TaxID=166011 RepID=A0A915CPP4_9BILA